jgi:hydrogenase maturation factor
MNLVFGEVMKVFEESGIRMGKIRVRRAIREAALELLVGIEPGDIVLLCDGIAVSKLQTDKTEKNCVLGNSRQAD